MLTLHFLVCYVFFTFPAIMLQTGDAGAVGDMYSVPDKSKKQKNAGVR